MNFALSKLIKWILRRGNLCCKVIYVKIYKHINNLNKMVKISSLNAFKRLILGFVVLVQ